MKTQSMAYRKDQKVFIDTPAGFITIKWRSKGHIDIEMPDDYTASRGEERASQNTRFLTMENGKVRASYSMLVPRVDDDGNVIGAEEPKVLSLGVKGKSNE